MRIIFSVGILTALILAACGNGTNDNGGSSVNTDVQGLSTYKNMTYNFQTDYPSSWVTDVEKTPGSVFSVRFDKVKKSKFPIWVRVWDKTVAERRSDILKEYDLVGENVMGWAKFNWNRIVVNTKDKTAGFVFLLAEHGDYLYELSGYGFESGIAVNDDVFTILGSSFDFPVW